MSEKTLAYRDFAPKRLRKRMIGADEYEDLNESVAAAAHWIRHQGVDVVNVETVALPNIWRKDEEGTADGSLRGGGNEDYLTQWHQFVRVWYWS